MTKKRIACLTMARDEDVFLSIWHRYYAGLFGAENLFVIDHNSVGKRPEAVLGAPDLNRFRIPFDTPSGTAEDDRHAFDRERFRFVSNLLSALLRYYDTVIFNDADEVFLPDPAVAPDLAAYLETNDVPVLAGVGLEIFHHPDEEPAYDPARPVFAQRSHYIYRFHHSKPHILSRPCVIGGHGSRQPFRLDPDLYLMHFKYLDWGRTLERQRTLNAFFQAGRGGKRSRWRFDAREAERRMRRTLALPRREGFVHHALLGRWLGQPAPMLVDTPPDAKGRRRGENLVQLTDILPGEEMQETQEVLRALPGRFRGVAV